MLKYQLTFNGKTAALVVLLSVMPLIMNAQWQKTIGINGDKVNSITIKDTVFFAGTDTGGVFKSMDKGLHWSAANGNLSTKNVKSIVAHNNRLVIGLGNGFSGAVYYSNDNGASWVTPKTQYYGFLFCMAKHGNDLLAGTWYGVVRSSDTGSTWNAVSASGLPSNAGVSAIVSNSSGIFAGVMTSSVGGTGVFFSTNGNSWTGKNTGLTNTVVLSMAMLNANLYAGTQGGGVFKSKNNGSTWDTANTGLGNMNINVLVEHGKDLFAGTNAGLYKSSDSGTKWVNIGDTTIGSAPVYSIAFQGGYMLVGTNSNLYRRSMSQVTVINQVTSDDHVIDVFPNPCNGILNISTRDRGEIKNIEVMDIGGRIIYSRQGNNEQVNVLNLTDLSQGVYLLRVYTGKGVANRRIVLR